MSLAAYIFSPPSVVEVLDVPHGFTGSAEYMEE